MWDATFSPDGHQLVTTDDQCAQVRDAQTGRLLFTLSHGDTVYQAVYSAGGARLITAGGDGTVRIWDAATGTLVLTIQAFGFTPAAVSAERPEILALALHTYLQSGIPVVMILRGGGEAHRSQPPGFSFPAPTTQDSTRPFRRALLMAARSAMA